MSPEPPKRYAIHAYVSPETAETLDFIHDETSISKTGIVETWLLSVRAQLAAEGWGEDAAEKVLGKAFLKAARKLDAGRRSRS